MDKIKVMLEDVDGFRELFIITEEQDKLLKALLNGDWIPEADCVYLNEMDVTDVTNEPTAESIQVNYVSPSADGGVAIEFTNGAGIVINGVPFENLNKIDDYTISLWAEMPPLEWDTLQVCSLNKYGFCICDADLHSRWITFREAVFDYEVKIIDYKGDKVARKEFKKCVEQE